VTTPARGVSRDANGGAHRTAARELFSPHCDRPQGADIRVLVIDGQPLSRIGLTSLVRSAGLDVVGEAGDAAAGAALGRRLTPDVALMDLELLGLPGMEAVQLMAASSPWSRIVTIIAHEHNDVILTLAAGALGCILRDNTTREVVGAIRAAARGQPSLSPSIVGGLARGLRLRTGDASRHLAALSPREIEVLALLARGWDNARIAAALYVSVGTVKHHVSNILNKLEVENRIQAAVKAVQDGLLLESAGAGLHRR
jgi:DNA-binding NarL/FixJ family response regulator